MDRLEDETFDSLLEGSGSGVLVVPSLPLQSAHLSLNIDTVLALSRDGALSGSDDSDSPTPSESQRIRARKIQENEDQNIALQTTMMKKTQRWRERQELMSNECILSADSLTATQSQNIRETKQRERQENDKSRQDTMRKAFDAKFKAYDGKQLLGLKKKKKKDTSPVAEEPEITLGQLPAVFDHVSQTPPPADAVVAPSRSFNCWQDAPSDDSFSLIDTQSSPTFIEQDIVSVTPQPTAVCSPDLRRRNHLEQSLERMLSQASSSQNVRLGQGTPLDYCSNKLDSSFTPRPPKRSHGTTISQLLKDTEIECRQRLSVGKRIKWHESVPPSGSAVLLAPSMRSTDRELTRATVAVAESGGNVRPNKVLVSASSSSVCVTLIETDSEDEVGFAASNALVVSDSSSDDNPDDSADVSVSETVLRIDNEDALLDTEDDGVDGADDETYSETEGSDNSHSSTSESSSPSNGSTSDISGSSLEGDDINVNGSVFEKFTKNDSQSAARPETLIETESEDEFVWVTPDLSRFRGIGNAGDDEADSERAGTDNSESSSTGVGTEDDVDDKTEDSEMSSVESRSHSASDEGSTSGSALEGAADDMDDNAAEVAPAKNKGRRKKSVYSGRPTTAHVADEQDQSHAAYADSSPKRQRGRPKKDVEVRDDSTPKGRGRPKKTRIVEATHPINRGGRPRKGTTELVADSEPSRRGRSKKVVEPEEITPKRGRGRPRIHELVARPVTSLVEPRIINRGGRPKAKR